VAQVLSGLTLSFFSWTKEPKEKDELSRFEQKLKMLLPREEKPYVTFSAAPLPSLTDLVLRDEGSSLSFVKPNKRKRTNADVYVQKTIKVLS